MRDLSVRRRLASLIIAGAFVMSPGPSSANSPPPTPVPAGPAPGFLRTFAETHGFLLGKPTRIRPTPDGKAILFLRSPPRDPTLGLYEMDVATGATRELITPADILKGAVEELSVAERARRERMRVTTRGFTTYGLSEDGARILLPLSGRLYIYDRADRKVRALGGSDGAQAPVVDPRLSPDGAHVAYVKGHDVFARDVATGRERAITKGGTAETSHGVAEFVAQEEMARFEGYWWSPDGKLIAYQETDHRGLERFTLADPARPEKAPDVFPYPRPGKANARVRLGITAAVGKTPGRTTWVKWDVTRYPYLARVVWKETAAPLCILVQTRDQREVAFLAVDVKTGATRTLHVETDDAWVALEAGLPRWLPGGGGFLLASERSAKPALELRTSDGRLDKVIVPPDAGFHELVHVAQDGRDITVLTASPVSTALVRYPLHGEGGGGAPTTLTSGKTSAEHEAVFAKNGAVYVDTRTTTDALSESTVRRSVDGSLVAVLPSTTAQPPFRARPELTVVRTPTGHEFHAALVRPRAFDRARRYPVIVNVYGGPTSLTVKSDERAYLLPQWIADHGAIVVSIDNRGTPRRDRAWSRAIKGSFGAIPLDDQVEALKALGARYRELDLGRVGIYGWSFGGYMSALAVLRRPDVFRAGVAGAPVVEWLDYDTHYTERYLDLPDKNPRGYQESSLLTYAAGLSRPLLLVHGTGDDNVYFFHTLKLADALFRAGRPYELLPLSVTHQVPDPVVRERLWERIVKFLFANLAS